MSPRHEIDLSNCYRSGGVREFDRHSPKGIAKSLSKCHDVNQAIIRSATETQRELMNLKLRNTLIASIVGGLLARAPEIFHWLLLITR